MGGEKGGLLTYSKNVINHLFFVIYAPAITQFSVPPTCDQLTSINLSKNELTSLPESLVDLENLVNFNASNNKLTKLPTRQVIRGWSLSVLCMCMRKHV